MAEYGGQGLTEEEKTACNEMFDMFDKDCDGGLDERELKACLLEFGQSPSKEQIQKMITEFDQNSKGFLNLCDWQTLIQQLDKRDFQRAMLSQKLSKNDIEEYDTIDAFVAMGGNRDKTGKIDANKLIEIVKNEFKMTIDIERLIKELDEDKSQQIEYKEFKQLLS